MQKIPILFYSDAPDQPTGLGRITKDLASLTAQLPEFKVGTFGKWGRGSSKLPFTQYVFDQQWGEQLIEEVWDDFAGSQQGIIFTIWDPSRLLWFANPTMGGPLQIFLDSGRFQRWGYFPVDSQGINGRLTGQCCDAIRRYHRVLAYSIYGSKVLSNSIGREVDWIPHGYNKKNFDRRDKAPGRMMLHTGENDILVGMVGTNQARKDWGCAAEAIAILRQKIPNMKFWVHTDMVSRYWNINALVNDFGLSDITRVTLAGQLSSEQLSYLYSACDCTFLISHEGFGYPLVESMACGVPVVHGRYGGGAELIPMNEWRVEELCLRMDTTFNIYRPVFSPEEWADTIHKVLKEAENGSLVQVCQNAVSHLQWENLWPATWKKWLLQGIGK